MGSTVILLLSATAPCLLSDIFSYIISSPSWRGGDKTITHKQWKLIKNPLSSWASSVLIAYGTELQWEWPPKRSCPKGTPLGDSVSRSKVDWMDLFVCPRVCFPTYTVMSISMTSDRAEEHLSTVTHKTSKERKIRNLQIMLWSQDTRQ